jgi:hypothetical protein
LRFKRKHIGYDKEFDSQFSQFLWENHKYKFYELNIRLEFDESVDEFEIFLDSVIKIDLKFKEISMSSNENELNRHQRITDLLIKHNIIRFLNERSNFYDSDKLRC